jgi:hypothetical protein
MVMTLVVGYLKRIIFFSPSLKTCSPFFIPLEDILTKIIFVVLSLVFKFILSNTMQIRVFIFRLKQYTKELPLLSLLENDEDY